MAHKLNRYETPVPEGHDGESIVLCDDCLDATPPDKIGEWLESKPSSRGCDGVDHQGCTNGNGDDDIPDDDEEEED